MIQQRTHSLSRPSRRPANKRVETGRGPDPNTQRALRRPAPRDFAGGVGQACSTRQKGCPRKRIARQSSYRGRPRVRRRLRSVGRRAGDRRFAWQETLPGHRRQSEAKTADGWPFRGQPRREFRIGPGADQRLRPRPVLVLLVVSARRLTRPLPLPALPRLQRPISTTIS